MRPPRDNPFRVDRVTALRYVGADVTALADRFLSLGRAAIVGPHGVGKSTLMRSIGGVLRDRGVSIVHVIVPGSATRAERKAALATMESADRDAVVLLDGYEQLTWPEARRVRRCPRLIVTAHGRTRLPTLITLRPSLDAWRAVLDELGVSMSDREVSAFCAHGGDVREALMTLFDAWASGDEKSPVFSPTNAAETLR